MKLNRILCAVDLSDQSGVVASYAAELARAFEAEIACVYVAPSLAQYVGFHVPPSSIDAFVGEIVTGADNEMKAFMTKHFKGLVARGVVVKGYAAEEIVSQAKELGADMIVMGTHGRRGFDRMLFGSVAEKVVKSAACPVLTVHP